MGRDCWIVSAVVRPRTPALLLLVSVRVVVVWDVPDHDDCFFL